MKTQQINLNSESYWDGDRTRQDESIDKAIELWERRKDAAKTREYWMLCQLNILLNIESSLTPIKNESEEGRREMWIQRKKAKRIQHLLNQLLRSNPSLIQQHEVN
jgi:hypothetical protein